jgi:putative nucleotidyltransferase with HDIG domain
VPPTLRRIPGGRAREAEGAAPALGPAERNAVALLAADARRRARLQGIWVFWHPAGADADQTRGVARARAPGTERGMSDAAARNLAVRALEGSRGRFARRVATFEEGLHVALAEPEGEPAVSVVASAPDRARLGPDAETALVQLAEIAARVLVALPVAGAPAQAAPRPAGYGAGLADALALLERPPILAESRARLERALGTPRIALGEAIRTVETDIGLAVAVVRAANRAGGRPRGGIGSAPAAIEMLGASATLELAAELPLLPPFGASDPLGMALARMSAHAIATRVASDILARHMGEAGREDLRLIALLHDVGKLALAAAGSEHVDPIADASMPPEDRIVEERRRLGLDHAALGAIALQRLGLPKRVAAAVERHHAVDATGPAALVRLADMLAHQAHGEAVTPGVLMETGRGLGLRPPELRRFAYEVGRSSEPPAVGTEPSPLTPAQQKVLEALGSGKTYKQIAAEQSLSVSTVRSHLHKVYERLGVADRAQAVLLARERGWM